MYYKITTSTGYVPDVYEVLPYCKWEPQTKCFLICGEDEKQGVISERRDRCYHVAGWPAFGVQAIEVTLSEITMAEYVELKEKLDKEGRDSEAIEQIKERLNEQDIDINDLTDAVFELAELLG